MRRRIITTDAVAFLVLAAALLAFGRQKMLRDPGTFWHTVVGDHIFSERALPRVDAFTTQRAGQPWIAQQWLAECAMALLHRAGGLDALLLASVVLLAATYAAALRRLTRAGVAWPLAALLIALVIAASSYHFLVRPHLVTIALTAWLYARLCDHDAGRTPPRHLWLLLPIFVLWTNLHAGAAGGLATLTLACAAWTLFGARQSAAVPLGTGHGARGTPRSIRNPQSAIRNPPMLLLALCLLTPLANPYGLALPRTWLTLLRSEMLPRMIQEHAPPSLSAPETWMLAALAAVYVFTVLTTDLKRLRATHLLPLAWAILAATRIRHGPLFAVMVPIALADLLPDSRIATWLRARGSDLILAPTLARAECQPLSPADIAFAHVPSRDPFARSPTIAAPAFAMLALGLCLQAAGIRAPLLGKNWAQLDPAYWPVGSLPALRAELAEHPDQPNVFNETLFGGFLIYFTPQARIFIDDRCELLGDDGLRAYLALAGEPARLRPIFDASGTCLALVARGSTFDRWFAAQSDWLCRNADSAGSLYVNKKKPPEPRASARPAPLR